jgi:PTH2 family peptidyl-tRNA hydrolase
MSEIKQVIVMRTDLNMRKGKMITQGAHAAMMFLTKELARSSKESSAVPIWTAAQLEWMLGNFKKITVGIGSEAELLDIFEKAQQAKLDVHLCVDNGLTEFKGVPTRTCLAIGPDHAEIIDQITGALKLL